MKAKTSCGGHQGIVKLRHTIVKMRQFKAGRAKFHLSIYIRGHPFIHPGLQLLESSNKPFETVFRLGPFYLLFIHFVMKVFKGHSAIGRIV